jgi:N-acetylglucosamine malate deacetylase 1
MRNSSEAMLKHGGTAVVVAPHADDEVLGAGGLIALATSRGWQVHVIYTTLSGYASMARGGQSSTAERRMEQEAAARVLGITSTEILFEGEDRHLSLDTVPVRRIVAFVEAAVARHRPDLVVMPCRGHYHQDHRVVAQACIAALRPAPPAALPLVPWVLAYGHTGFAWGGHECRFEPTVFVDVTDVIEKKLEAMACYQSQLCQPPHPRNAAGMRTFASSWGACAGVPYAEPYECMRSILS